jgi:phytanoyl-CoA hydroxylase
MLSSEEISAFHRDGFLLGPRVIGDDTLAELKSELERVSAHANPGDPHHPLLRTNLGTTTAPVWQIVDIWLASEAFRSLLSNHEIVSNVVQLTGATNLKVWHDQVQYKPSGAGGVNMWHQDSPIWLPITPKDQQVTAWVALDDADETNGCMSMVPGSHNWGDHLAFLEATQDFSVLPNEHDGHIVTVVKRPVRAGHVHFHHALTWHGSHANTSARPRRAIAIHYMTERTRYVDEPSANAKRFAALLDVSSEPGASIDGPYFATVYDNGEVTTVDQPAVIKDCINVENTMALKMRL